MKKKLLFAIIVLTCAFCLVFALAGCKPAASNQSGAQQTPGGGSGGDDKPHTHNYIFKYGQTEHWQACTVCGEEKDRGGHAVSDGVCPACGYVEKCTEGLKFTEIKENEEIIGYSVSQCTPTDNHIFIPSFYNNVPVTSIDGYALNKCTSLTEITISGSVTFIGVGAFSGCTCLKEITIPARVTSIGADAFGGCKNLKEITIPDSVTSIGYGAFEDCTSLKGVYINDIASWCNIDFKDYSANPLVYAGSLYLKGQLVTKLEIPDGVTAIKDYVFEGFGSLKEITIPDSVTSIGDGAFSGCKRLKEITIPDGVTSIGSGAFYDTAYYNNAYNWKNDVLYIGNCLIEAKDTLSGSWGSYQIAPDTKLIAASAFPGCESLNEIIIPDSVTSIGYDAFKGCTNIMTARMPTLAIKYIPKNNLQTVFLTSGESIGNQAFRSCEWLIKITIPDSVTSIGTEAFSGCIHLDEITIPNSVISIGIEAFYGCSSLKEITIPNSVTSIGEYAFAGCTGLIKMTIGYGVTSIGYETFHNCIRLERVIFENTADWKVSTNSGMSNSEEINVNDPAQNAKNLKGKYCDYYWTRG